MILPILISVSLAPGSYFFCALAAVAIIAAANAAMATKLRIPAGIVLSPWRFILFKCRKRARGLRHLNKINRQGERTMPAGIRSFVAIAAFAAAMIATAASAQKKYDPGASDTEIKIGNIMPYSGPASAYGVIGKAEAAYFRKINEEGGINGRKIDFISYDDAFSPPKAVEQARKLVESDEVLFIFQSLGTPSNTAIQKYMNTKK